MNTVHTDSPPICRYSAMLRIVSTLIILFAILIFNFGFGLNMHGKDIFFFVVFTTGFILLNLTLVFHENSMLNILLRTLHILLITYLIYLLGGIQANSIIPAYLMIIIFTGILYSRSQTYYTTLCVIASYLTMIILQYRGAFIPPLISTTVRDIGIRFYILHGSLNTIFMVMSAVISIFVIETLRKKSAVLQDYSEEIQKSIREKTGKLERTKTHLDKLINSAREFAVISIDDEGTIVSFSEGSKGIFGWKPEEIEGANISRLRTGDDPGSIKRLLKRALKTFSRTSSIDQISETRVRMIRKDGSQFIGDISLSPIIIDSERPGFIVIIHDITIKNEIEKKLAKSRQRYKGFIEALRDSLFTLDRDGNFLWANKYFVELSGYSIDELISDIRPGNIFVLSEDRDKKFQEMSSWATEMKLVHKSGKHIPVSLTMSTIKEEGAEIGMVGVLKDLTKTKENEEHLNNYTHELQKSRSELEKANQKLIAQQEELKISKTELEKLNKMKNSFIASLSQELKTPLVAGMGYIDLILNGDAGVIDNEIQNYLQISFRNFKKLTIMIDNLLTMSAFSQDDALPSFGVVDLASRLHEWIEEDIHARNATVTVDIPQAASMVYADEYFLSQVFSNLLQFSKEKDERVPYINIDAAPRPNKKVEVSYHDENMDLSEDEAEHIFDSFLESELDPDSSMGISDMGMSIVKSIIELHGGTIEINPSGNTKGTRFVFSLQRHMD